MPKTANMPRLPSLEDFMALPIEEVRNVAPQTIILTNGGTRRRAVLAGVSPISDEYARMTREQMIECFSLVFDHGVRHIFSTVLAETNYHETTPGYREKLADWVQEGLAGSEALMDYHKRNWRVQLLGTDSWPELEPISTLIRKETAKNSGPRLWLMANSSDEHHWKKVFAVVQKKPGLNRSQIIRVMFDEDIPLATLYLGSGKPQITTSNVPLILIGNLQCYWRQHLGYDLDEQTLRTILYDYAYLRKTWTEDKTGRAEEVLNYKEMWEEPPVIGIGKRVGPFWYPT